PHPAPDRRWRPIGVAHPALLPWHSRGKWATFRLVVNGSELPGLWVCDRRRFVPLGEGEAAGGGGGGGGGVGGEGGREGAAGDATGGWPGWSLLAAKPREAPGRPTSTRKPPVGLPGASRRDATRTTRPGRPRDLARAGRPRPPGSGVREPQEVPERPTSSRAP